MDSNNLEKNELVCCEFEIAYKPLLEDLKNESHTYCGRIFASEKETFTFICTFCEELFLNIEHFKSHINHYHQENMKWKIRQFYHENTFQSTQTKKDITTMIDTNRESDIQYTHHINEKQNVNEFLVHKTYGKKENLAKCITRDTKRNEVNKTHDNEQNTKKNNTIVEKSKNTNEFSFDIDTNTNNDELIQSNSDISFLSDDNYDHSETRATKKNLKNGSTKLNNEICDENVGSEEELQNHNLVDHSETNFVSSTNQNIIYDICNASFTTEQNFETHLSVCCAKTGKGEIKMSITAQSNDASNEDSEKSCEENISNYKLINVKNFTCKNCNKIFHSKAQYFAHTMLYEDIYKCEKRTEKKKFSCQICDIRFYTAKEEKMHKKIVHNTRLLICKICNKTCFNAKILEIHAFTHQRRVQKCEICGAILRDKQGLNLHMKRHGEKKYKCGYCYMKFVTIIEKKHHERIHTGEKPFECNQCKKKFRLKSSLRKHSTSHTKERKYLCPECGFAFTLYSNFLRHLKLHKIKKPISYDCSICQKKYNKKLSFVNHMKTHSNTEYSCAECGRVFTHHLGLAMHMKKHKREQQN